MTNQKISILKNLVYSGAKKKNLEITDAVLDRISLELSVINSSDFTDYFILYSRIIEVCNSMNLFRSSGREGVASSLVNYCLDISCINPLEHNLIFERFINYKITQSPDIDIDIPKGYQSKVINDLKQKYPEYYTYFIAHELQKESDPIEIMYNNVAYKKHPCGIIIITETLSDSVFNYKNQDFYHVKDLANDSFFSNKIDLLELDYLNRFQFIVEQIGKEYHPFSLPTDDKAVFTFLSKGESENIFQFNTQSMSRILGDFKPNNINDLSILNATFKPRSLDLIPNLIENKHYGYEKFQNPLINKLLDETYGILVYQETFLEILKQIAGFTYEDADLWRVKLINSKSDDLIKLLSQFLDVFNEKIHYLSKKDIIKLNHMIKSNLMMIFPKSHSLSYSLIAYWGGFYKTHFNSIFEEIFSLEINYETLELYKR
jgi:DNA polymerase III subunit alpha